MDHADSDSVPWFTVHELSLLAYHFQHNQSTLDPTSPNHIPILDQRDGAEVLQPYMATNQLCIVKNIDSSPNPHAQHLLPALHNSASNGNLQQHQATLNLDHPTWPSMSWSHPKPKAGDSDTTTAPPNYTFFNNPYFNGFVPPSHLTPSTPYPILPPNPLAHPPQPLPQQESAPSLEQSLNHHLNQTTINFQHFLDRYGQAEVTISDCLIRDSNSQHTAESTLAAYLHEWRDHVENSSKSDPNRPKLPFLKYCRDFHLSLYHFESAIPNNTDPQAIESTADSQPHGLKQPPKTNPSFYTPPLCVSDDYLNLHWDLLNTLARYRSTPTDLTPTSVTSSAQSTNPNQLQLTSSPPNPTTPTLVDDYRFVYFGPQGSLTPCHRDVYASYSWSGNVCGTKLWLFLPPHFLPLTQSDPLSPSVDVFDLFDEASVRKCSDENGRIFSQAFLHATLAAPQLDTSTTQTTPTTTLPSTPTDLQGHNNTKPSTSPDAPTPHLSLHTLLKFWITTLRLHLYGFDLFNCPSNTLGVSPAIYQQWQTQYGHIAFPKILLQSQGDLVFVPSFWAHQVINLTDCISINHNWGNSFNLPSMAKQLVLDNIAIKAELDEYRTDVSDSEFNQFLPISIAAADNRAKGEECDGVAATATCPGSELTEVSVDQFVRNHLNDLITPCAHPRGVPLSYKHYPAAPLGTVTAPPLNDSPRKGTIQNTDPNAKRSILETYHVLLSLPFTSTPLPDSSNPSPLSNFTQSTLALSLQRQSTPHPLFNNLPSITPPNPIPSCQDLTKSLKSLLQLTTNPKVSLFDDLQTEQVILRANSGMNLTSLHQILVSVILFTTSNLIMTMHALNIVAPLLSIPQVTTNNPNTDQTHPLSTSLSKPTQASEQTDQPGTYNGSTNSQSDNNTFQSGLFDLYRHLDLVYQSTHSKDLSLPSTSSLLTQRLNPQHQLHQQSAAQPQPLTDDQEASLKFPSPLEVIDIFMHQNHGYQALIRAFEQPTAAPLNVQPSHYLAQNSSSSSSSQISQTPEETRTTVDTDGSNAHCDINNQQKHNSNGHRAAKLAQWRSTRPSFHFDAFSDAQFYGLSPTFQSLAELLGSKPQSPQPSPTSPPAAISATPAALQPVVDHLFRYITHCIFALIQVLNTYTHLHTTTDLSILLSISTTLSFAPPPRPTLCSTPTTSDNASINATSHINKSGQDDLEAFITTLHSSRDADTASLWALYKPFQDTVQIEPVHFVSVAYNWLRSQLLLLPANRLPPTNTILVFQLMDVLCMQLYDIV